MSRLAPYIARLLVVRGDAVGGVADGEAALAAARRQPPGLILADVMMPALDGAALLAAIRADPNPRDTPVVLLSARAGEEARAGGMRLLPANSPTHGSCRRSATC